MNPLSIVDHRPWPLPKRPWIMVQVWRDLLFAHWNLPAAAIRGLVPQQLELDTFDGWAWVSITPFHMSVRLRGLPPFPGMLDFPELNCRTYVTAQGKPGIYFFSLDTANRAAVWGARTFYHLPYFHARMQIEKENDSISYSSKRGDALWRGTYTPTSAPRRAEPGSLDYPSRPLAATSRFPENPRKQHRPDGKHRTARYSQRRFVRPRVRGPDLAP
jgi:uncharacterized protein